MKKKDILLIIVILLIAGAGYVLLNVSDNYKDENNNVVIRVEGKIYGTYPLNKNKEIIIDVKKGYNKIEIKNGYVYMKDADCPDKYCVEQGRKSRAGSTIVCLPHKVTVQINAVQSGKKKTNSDNKDVDIIAE